MKVPLHAIREEITSVSRGSVQLVQPETNCSLVHFCGNFVKMTSHRYKSCRSSCTSNLPHSSNAMVVAAIIVVFPLNGTNKIN